MTTYDDEPDDLRARLRHVDPAASLPPADPDRVARLLEDTMSHDTERFETREAGTRSRGPLTWLVAAAAAVVIAGVAIFAVTGARDGDDRPPGATDSTGGGPTEPASVTELTAASGPGGRCMTPNARLLTQQDVALRGTVQEITDGVVVLAPERFYAGEETDLVEVRAPAEELAALVGAVDFEAGGTYLVSATDGEVTVCGFSGPATPQLEALYDEAFPG